ncbi:hypothetical protein COMNV_00505 [Commensalibacter sp. Nvir]|nr:hypothetical protein COMNV_00505 [Commensalibacter sp. Nvir]
MEIMEWNEKAVARLRELWLQGLSTAEIGRHLNVTKNAVVGKVHRLGLEGRPSPIRKPRVKNSKEEADLKQNSKPSEKEIKPSKTGQDQYIKQARSEKKNDLKNRLTDKIKKPKIEFVAIEETPKKRPYTECCWPIGDPGTKGFHFCGAPAIPGKPYCLEHIQIAYVKLRDRKNNAA